MAWFVPAIIAGAQAFSSYLANRKKKQEQKSTSDQATSLKYSRTGTTTPTYSAEDLALKQFVTNLLRNQIFEDPNLEAYQAGGIRDINRTSGISDQLLRSTLAARGLSYSPAAIPALQRSQQNRLSQISSFLAQLPLLRRQLREGSVGNLAQFFSSLPVGQTTTESGTQEGTGTMTQEGTIIQQGNPGAAAFAGAANALAQLYGAGAFQENPSSGASSNLLPSSSMSNLMTQYGPTIPNLGYNATRIPTRRTPLTNSLFGR